MCADAEFGCNQQNQVNDGMKRNYAKKLADE